MTSFSDRECSLDVHLGDCIDYGCFRLVIRGCPYTVGGQSARRVQPLVVVRVFISLLSSNCDTTSGKLKPHFCLWFGIHTFRLLFCVQQPVTHKSSSFSRPMFVLHPNMDGDAKHGTALRSNTNLLENDQFVNTNLSFLKKCKYCVQIQCAGVQPCNKKGSCVTLLAK